MPTDNHEASWAHLEASPLKIVFVAGPYIGDGTVEAIEANIREAEQYAIALANAGIGFFCPHLHTEHFGTKATADEPFYHRLDFQFLLRSDAALFTPRWQTSSGARREHDWAVWKGLPIFYPPSPDDISEVVEWTLKGSKRCLECGQAAVWVRRTQFSGDHYFCQAHAEQEDDFGKTDPSYYVWERVEA